jgi:dihydroorotase
VTGPSAGAVDLLITGGRLLCPATGLDGPGAVAVTGDRITAAGSRIPASAKLVIALPEAVLVPGLVDLHAHPGQAGSRYGVDPDLHLLPHGTTTVLSQGDAGADGWPGYRDHVIRPARTRVRMALNLSRRGESMPQASFESLDDADVEACLGAIRADGEEDRAIWGIAVNVGPIACGQNDPRPVLARALEASARSGRPLLFGPRRHPDWSFDEQLDLLRPGDVVTYCYHAMPENLLVDGRVRDSAWAARERGVLFDLGHGMGSFSFPVAEAAVAQGFLPDTISTDRYRKHLELSPRHDLPRTLSKLLAVGLSEAQAFAAVTSRPAAVLGLDGQAGTLAPGAPADLVALAWNPEAAPLRDVAGLERPGGAWEPRLTVRAGVVVPAPARDGS